MGELEGKVVIVTGAGNGIGRESALALARAGASVLVNDIGTSVEGVGASAGPAQQVAEEIAAIGGHAASNCDSVASLDAVRRMVEQARDQLGGLHAIVHPAGISRRAPLKDMSEEDFDSVIATHLRGAFNVARASLQLFLDQDEGAYVFFTSTAGLYGEQQLANYAAAKLGVVGFNKVVAMETAGTGVRSNAISPFAWTRMVDSISDQLWGQSAAAEAAKAAVRADQVAQLVVALCSPRIKASGQVFGARGNELMVFGDMLPTRSIAAVEGWTPEAIIDRALPAMKPGYSALANAVEMFSYPPL